MNQMLRRVLEAPKARRGRWRGKEAGAIDRPACPPYHDVSTGRPAPLTHSAARENAEGGIDASRVATDAERAPTLCGAMQLGSLVIHKGRPYYLRGLDPMSVSDRQAELDAFTGARVSVPFDEVEEHRRPGRPQGFTPEP
jgi:hypothetical protein